MARREQHGAVLPTTVLVGCIAAVTIAALGFILTVHPGHKAQKPDSATVTSARPSVVPKAITPARQHKAPAVRRTKVDVVVFNNSNIKGLAGRTAARAHRLGWKVVGQDNWYGTISTSTVYYPTQLKRPAKLLAHDLRIHRVMPSVTPMQTDRLTVILTADYSD